MPTGRSQTSPKSTKMPLEMTQTQLKAPKTPLPRSQTTMEYPEIHWRGFRPHSSYPLCTIERSQTPLL